MEVKLIDVIKRITKNDKRKMQNFIETIGSFCHTAIEGTHSYHKFQVRKAFADVILTYNVCKYESEDLKTTRGYHNGAKSVIFLNGIFDDRELEETVFHEIMHAVQLKLGYDFSNYIVYDGTEKGYFDYRFQRCEREARTVGRQTRTYGRRVLKALATMKEENNQ